MKLSNLIGKTVVINENCEELYYEFEYGVNYKDYLEGKKEGIVYDIGSGREINIIVNIGGFLYDFNDIELLYNGELISEVISEWDYNEVDGGDYKDVDYKFEI